MGSKRKRNRSKKVSFGNKSSQEEQSWHQWIRKYIKRPWGILLVMLTITASVLGIVSYVHYRIDKQHSSATGMISPPSFASVKYLSIGSTRFLIDSPEGVFLKDGDIPVLTMNIKDRKLLVTTTIRDTRGNIVAELKNNEWRVNKNNIFDRNYTNNALEVRDQSGKIALQVVHFGDTIHLAGIFHCRNGWTNVFMPLPEGGAIIDIKPPGKEPEHSIQQIFEYPSELHFGSSPGLASLEKLIIHGPGPAYRLSGALDICRSKQK